MILQLDIKKMRVLRAEKDLTQESVAKTAEISQNHYSSIERGQRIPRIEVLNNIAKALGCSVKDLILEDS
ncbi:helix-turn-helix transcriptional regulator [Synergistes jonesii]|uniref:helix-turn-helix transcriptional regulator n=1 Tax=Synergistes jonesii TaxID=2754 RepID=UPI00242CDB6E|nr:helix-turn-helix transcriptional regulator [Synergistes jonesii]